MADTKPTRSDNPKDTAPTIARREQGQGAVQHRPFGGSWFSSPFEFMDRMAEEMDRTFGRMFRDVGLPRGSWLTRNPLRLAEREGLWSPRLESFQKGDRLIVRAELPGVKKDDVQVDISDDVLTIHGDRHEERQEEREGYYHSELEYGHFHRAISLPEGVITETAQASFKDGVLEVSMQVPPAEATRGRRLEIKESTEAGEKSEKK